MFRRDGSGPTYGMDAVRPIEIPVISQVKHLLAEDRYPEAVTLAYQTAVLDLQRAYHNAFPAHWTHPDVLQWARRDNLGLVADLLGRLYLLYQPVRYGRSPDITRGDVLSFLTSLYAQSPLWRIYTGYAYVPALGGADASGAAWPPALPPP